MNRTKKALALAATAYVRADVNLAAAALTLSLRPLIPQARRARYLAALVKGGGVAPAGYGFLRIGSPGSSQLVRVGSDSAAPRILIPTGA